MSAAVLLVSACLACGACGACSDDGAGRLVTTRNDTSTGASADVDASAGADAVAVAGACPDEMVLVDSTGPAGTMRFCIDRYEAHVVELDAQGKEHPRSPYATINDAIPIRAKSARGVVPQAYISQVQSARACANANKRLCQAAEFQLACRGPDPGNAYPYGGQTKVPGACNEGRGSQVPKFYGTDFSKWTYADFNDPRLNEQEQGLALTGAHAKCVSPFGVYDLVGNLHEWGIDGADSSGHGRFRGGFYGDAEVNGHGCLYVTSAHELTYHDYSTGFRCCKDATP